jgi:hypothetical protein
MINNIDNMCSINHNLKAVFIHVHKTGGTYVSYMLHKYYGFKNYYLRRPDHDKFCLNKEKKTKYINYENRVHGVLKYYKTSPHLNKKMGMTPQKWDSYYKFCFIRNPYDKIVSAWNHVNRFRIPFLNYLNLTKTCNDVEYMHVFLPQIRNIINEKNQININFIGKFENLEADFQRVLINIGVKNIIHDVNKSMNKREHKDFYEYYDQETLNRVNLLLVEDFKSLPYPIFYNIDDFKNAFHNNEDRKIPIIDNNSNEDTNEDTSSGKDKIETPIEIPLVDILEIKEEEQTKKLNSICCFYAYYEKDISYKYNFTYFLTNGILDNVDYYIIINGDCTVSIPIKDNIKVFRRPNFGYDFGAYSYGIRQLKDRSYDYYFFVNTSVIGPYFKETDKSQDWTQHFLDLFTENVKLVGTTINILDKKIVTNYNLQQIYKKDPPYVHVQTMFFAIDKEYFQYLNSIHFFNEVELYQKDFNYIIIFKEIGLSQIALSKGWKINCLLDKYKDLDYSQLKKDINSTSRNGDPYYLNSYFGNTIKRDDVIFFKMNRFFNSNSQSQISK